VAGALSLEPVDDDLWVVHAPLRFFGFEIGTRMTVVRLAGGGLWLCAPVPIDEPLAGALTGLGPIEHLVGPNRWHHLFLGPARERFPEAALHLAPGLADKRPDLRGAATLGDTPPAAWADDLDQCVLGGVPTFNEVAFLHRKTRTLVLTDHLFHLDATVEPSSTRLLGRLLGVFKAPGFPRDARYAFVKDATALAACMKQVLAWDFDRVVLCHGRCVDHDGKVVLERTYADYLARLR
jgi:hypothetical protein